MARGITDTDAVALSRGSQEAFTRVYRALSGPLHAFLVRATDGETARDLLQEVWMKVLRSGHLPERGEEIRPWVFRIAYHVAVDRWRAGRRATGGSPLPAEVAADRRSDPRARAEGREIGERIRAALRTLPEEQRAVFLLREEAGIPFREIAEVLGIPMGTALARMRYALARLRRTLRQVAAEEQS